MKKRKILSLDISSVSTGWSIFNGKDFVCGIISLDKKMDKVIKLQKFRKILTEILLKEKPTDIVIEAVFMGINVRTIKILSEFSGVAQECCLSTVNIIPYVVENTTVKSFFKVRKKENLYDFILSLFDLKKDDVPFKENNDIVDSIAQNIYYCDIILNYVKFRIETKYGYKYDIKRNKFIKNNTSY